MTAMNVRELNTGPVVLPIHGIPTPSDLWMPIAAQLATRYRVLVPELPGHGGTPPLAEPAAEGYADALAAMLYDRKVTHLHAIAGVSGGAYFALDLVLRHPIDAKLIISLSGLATLDEPARAWRRDVSRRIAIDPGLIERELDPMIPGLLLSQSWRVLYAADATRAVSWLHQTTPLVLAKEVAALAALRDLRPDLPKPRSALYLRAGTADVACPPEGSEEMARLAPLATLELVPGCGHALLIEDALATSSAIIARIDAIRAPGMMRELPPAGSRVSRGTRDFGLARESARHRGASG